MKNIFFKLEPFLEHKFLVIMNEGIQYLELDLGIVSRIYEDIYRVYGVTENESNIQLGDDFELSKTYCSDICNQVKTLYYEDVAKITGMSKHPCYLTTQLRAYIGTPILIKNQFWGTLNYSSLQPKKLHYNSLELEFIEQQAGEIGELLQRFYKDPFSLK